MTPPLHAAPQSRSDQKEQPAGWRPGTWRAHVASPLRKEAENEKLPGRMGGSIGMRTRATAQRSCSPPAPNHPRDLRNPFGPQLLDSTAHSQTRQRCERRRTVQLGPVAGRPASSEARDPWSTGQFRFPPETGNKLDVRLWCVALVSFFFWPSTPANSAKSAKSANSDGLRRSCASAKQAYPSSIVTAHPLSSRQGVSLTLGKRGHVARPRVDVRLCLASSALSVPRNPLPVAQSQSRLRQSGSLRTQFGPRQDN